MMHTDGGAGMSAHREPDGVALAAEEGGRGKLPPELVSDVIRALFTDADAVKGQAWSDNVDAFHRLRLVATRTKADAHEAWPAGLGLLAGQAAAKLLRPGLSPAAFDEGLDEARPVLEETKVLDLGLPQDRHNMATITVGEQLAWFSGVKQILSSTRALDTLSLHCAGASLALHELPLSHLPLKALRMTKIAKGALVGMDLSQMGALDSLEVQPHPLGGEGAPDLAGFSLPPRASTIKLTWTDMTSDQVEALALDRVLDLRHLDLTGSQLQRPLPAMAALKALVLTGTRIDDHFLSSLVRWSSLEELHVGGGTSITSVAPLTLATNTLLKRLDVSGTGIQDAATFELKTNTGLRALKIGACEFTSLALGLASNTTLRALSLTSCCFTVPLMQQLTGELAGNSTLAKLDLDYCYLRDQEMVHFKLERTSGLQEVNLANNYDLSEDGLQPLVESILEHDLLRTLDLSYSGIITEQLASRLSSPRRTVVRRW